jgi:HAE1 family hydrophobic/amphiphilic exporter-1
MSRLSELAVSKRSVTLLLAVALFSSGIFAWGTLKQELLPDIELPVITVIAPYPGAGAADVAEQVAKPVERVISSVPRLERLQSVSANSIALVIAQFSFGTNVKDTLASIEQNMQGAGLPDGVDPQTTALNINAAPVIIASIAATSEDGLAEAAGIARSEIVPELLGIEGVESADITGGLEQRVVVTLDPDKLAVSGISAQQVSGILAANNLTFPAGQLPSSGDKIPVSTIGRLTSLDEIRGLVVGVAGATGAPGAQPRPVTLGEVGTVELTGLATTGYARTNGSPALTLSVTKTSTANTVQVAEAVTEKLAEIGGRHASIRIDVVSDLSAFILESQDGLLREGGLGAIFAVLTIFLFLFSLRSTLVAAVSIPLSILTALVAMQAWGISLNVMTLGGLAVAVGRVVDDAIVVLENIYRHRALGDSKLTAVIKGPREVATAITSATVTTVGVFLPLGFVGGLVSQFFLPFALTVTFALLASLVVALTVVPVLAYLFIDRVTLNVDEDGEPRNSPWIRVYTPTIRLALRNRLTKLSVIAISLLLFVSTGVIAPLLPTQFINAGSEKILQVTVAPPGGASSDAVLARAAEAEQILLGDRERFGIELVQTSVPGEGDTSFQTIVAAASGRPANSATLTVRLSANVDLTESAKVLSDALAPIKSDGYDVAVAQTAGFTSNSLNIIVATEDPELLQSTSDIVLAALRDNPDLLNLKSNLTKAAPEIQVVVDPGKAIGVGSSAAQVAGEVRAALTGSVATRVQLPDQPDAVAVLVQLDPGRVTSVEALRQLLVGTVAKVPLGAIATVDQVDVQGSITRIDESPAAAITAEITSGDTGAVSRDVQRQIEELEADGTIPSNVEVRLAGVTEQMNEAFGGLFFSMAVAILLVYIAMVLTFNSLITPFIILFSLPLATIGAFPALLLTDRPVGVSALIGFLMLIGIVVTNAIVLLDLVERLRAQGLSTTEALIEGGRTRVRPILMTAIATILALIPLAAGLNQGSIIAAELGTVVIGGLFSSTFLTLLVVPVVYSLVDGFRSRWTARGSGSAAAGEPGGGPEGAPAG